MLTHHCESTEFPKRVVVLGSRGFLGARFMEALNDNGVNAVGISSKDIDLSASDAHEALTQRLAPGDSLVIFSALTPDKGRDIGTLMTNLAMIQAVAGALEKVAVEHVVYISSDAVYSLDQTLVNEATCAEPSDLYSAMHKTREVMLQSVVAADKLAILRPTLIYGQGDPHNSYGPNRLRRMALNDRDIRLFGQGEETRDNIFIDDVIALVQLVLKHKSSGLLNLATGSSVSYDDLARSIATLFDEPVSVSHTERSNPITHRRFDVTALHKAFPAHTFTPLDEGLAIVHGQMMARVQKA